MSPAPNEKYLAQKLTTSVTEYSVNPSECTVLYHPIPACFRYDDADNLRLLYPKTVAPEITQGAEEALRQERKRDPGIGKFVWCDRKGRGGS